MVKCFFILIFLTSEFVYSQEFQEPKEHFWIHLDGVSNPDYNVFIDTAFIEYDPGKYIVSYVKYDLKNGTQKSTYKLKFLIPENLYIILYINLDYDGEYHIDVPIEEKKRIAPGSEMSVIYQSVYTQAVIKGPTKK